MHKLNKIALSACIGLVLGAGQAQHLTAVLTLGQDDVDKAHAAGSDGAGLVAGKTIFPSGHLVRNRRWSYGCDARLPSSMACLRRS